MQSFVCFSSEPPMRNESEEHGVYKVWTPLAEFTTYSMGTHMQNKISMDVAADSSSPDSDSLSFAGLVCIQDQQSKSSTERVYLNNKDDQEFEFVSGTPSTSPHSLKKNCHPDMIIPNSHLPLKFLLKSAQATNKPCYKQSGASSLGSSRNTPIDNHADHTKVSHKSNQEGKNQVRKNQTATRPSFGQKLFQSFVSPCRECRAVKPTVKAHVAPQQSIKLQ